ncbi:hypothetical protein ACFYKX_11435 [Cytobacillus sp. FJAT-54145]|uniref:Uncharacterized protein n=1 Tax=Cytobacillus spartinae TaxID=3299023 RepID=A0ABW6KE85_9BACI
MTTAISNSTISFTLITVLVPKSERFTFFEDHHKQGIAGMMDLNYKQEDESRFTLLVKTTDDTTIPWLEQLSYLTSFSPEPLVFQTTRDDLLQNKAGIHALHVANCANRLHSWQLKMFKYLENAPTDEKWKYPSTDWSSMLTTALKLNFPEWYEEMNRKSFSLAQIQFAVSQSIYPFRLEESSVRNSKGNSE